MRRAFCKIWISVVCITVVTSVAGCGGGDAPNASSVAAPNPSSAPVDPNVAFRQYEKAVKPFECSKAYGQMGDAHHDGELGLMKDKAREHRDVVATCDAQFSKIAFPAR